MIRFGLVVLVLSTLATVTAFWDHRRWARRAEAFRLGMLMGGGIALVLTGATTADTLAAVVAVCALSGGALPPARAGAGARHGYPMTTGFRATR